MLSEQQLKMPLGFFYVWTTKVQNHCIVKIVLSFAYEGCILSQLWSDEEHDVQIIISTIKMIYLDKKTLLYYILSTPFINCC